ncbi:lipase/esterase, partial [Aspergillus udagawae]
LPNKSLKEISHYELKRVEEQVYERAKKLDLQDHIAKSTTATQKDIKDALFQPLQDGPLDLIILRVKTRPDAFSMPSLNSVFPFLEATWLKLEVAFYFV